MSQRLSNLLARLSCGVLLLAVSLADGERADAAASGAHDTHVDTYPCKVCHAHSNTVKFDPAGPAYKEGWPAPSFDPAAKTCINIGCHGGPSGTFSYYFPGGDGEPVLNAVPYGSSPGFTSPPWTAAPGSGACHGCHGNPPRIGYTWHSGLHGAQGASGANNQCQLCHPDATGVNGAGTGITDEVLHGDGVVQVQGRFTSTCFGCH